MRVALFISVLVVHAMDGDKEDRAALQGEGTAYGENILHPFRGLVASMREEPMVSHPDADAASDPPEKHRYEERLPGKEEQGNNGTDMKDHHEEGGDPNDGLRKCSVVPWAPHEDLFSWLFAAGSEAKLRCGFSAYRGCLHATRDSQVV